MYYSKRKNELTRNSNGSFRIVNCELENQENRQVFYSYDTIIGYKNKNRLNAVFTDRGYSVTTRRHKSQARDFFNNNVITIDERLFDIVKSPYKKDYMIKELTAKTTNILTDLHEIILKSRKSKKRERLEHDHAFYNELLLSNFERLF